MKIKNNLPIIGTLFVLLTLASCELCQCDSFENLTYSVELLDRNTGDNITADFDTSNFKANMTSMREWRAQAFEANRIVMQFPRYDCSGIGEEVEFIVNDTLREAAQFVFSSDADNCCGCENIEFQIGAVGVAFDSQLSQIGGSFVLRIML